uniref:Uncharacterized protein n=1 Tax=Arundo donax TaxID=35708 RepID=A0A0A8YR00_ARUDO
MILLRAAEIFRLIEKPLTRQPTS